jgi:ribose transport system substrate-binding protein
VKTRGLAGKIKLVTFDTSQGLLDELKSGVIDAMIVQDPPKIGYEAVRTLVDKLNGRVPPKRIDLMPKVVRREDVKT